MNKKDKQQNFYGRKTKFSVYSKTREALLDPDTAQLNHVINCCETDYDKRCKNLFWLLYIKPSKLKSRGVGWRYQFVKIWFFHSVYYLSS